MGMDGESEWKGERKEEGSDMKRGRRRGRER